MKCISCGCRDNKVIDSRYTSETNSIRRRRECLKCGKRWTTYESVESAPIMVIKKNGAIQPFNKTKIINGILKSCEKRPVSLIDIENIVSSIEQELKDRQVQEIKSVSIGEMVMDKLKFLDRIAYIRFASVYREFNDTNSFIELLKSEN